MVVEPLPTCTEGTKLSTAGARRLIQLRARELSALRIRGYEHEGLLHQPPGGSRERVIQVSPKGTVYCFLHGLGGVWDVWGTPT